MLTVFPTLKIIQAYLSQRNDKRSFWVLSNICANTVLQVYQYAIHKCTVAQSY